MCKALAVGASSVMVGRLVAGCEESPGKAFMKDGKFVKMFRGMAGCNYSLMQCMLICPKWRGLAEARMISTHRLSALRESRVIFHSRGPWSTCCRATATASRAV